MKRQSTVSEFKRIQRRNRIAAGSRPPNCVVAMNKEAKADAVADAKKFRCPQFFERLHATKGYRRELV